MEQIIDEEVIQSNCIELLKQKLANVYSKYFVYDCTIHQRYAPGGLC